MLRRGYHVAVYVEAKEPPYRHHGEFLSEDEENVRIKSTIGDNTGNEVLVPKSRITHIEITSKRERV